MIVSHFNSQPDARPVQAPPVFALSQWVVDQSRTADLLLGNATAMSPDSFELRSLWESIIFQGIPGIAAEECEALSAQAISAERLLEQWGSEETAIASAASASHFQRWRMACKKERRSRNWFTAGEWLQHFTRQIDSHQFPAALLPESITLFGFVELTRLENRLLEALRTRGTRVKHADASRNNPSVCHKAGFPDLDHEIAAAALWARQQMEAGSEQIAIIVNEIGTLGRRVQTILDNTFRPLELLTYSGTESTSYYLAQGATLAANPMVSDALLMLKLAMGGRHKAHDFSEISRLLLSDCWQGGGQERFARAQLEISLREAGQYRCTLSDLAGRISQCSNSAALHQTRDCLNQILQRPAAGRSRVEAVTQMLEWLRCWGWPGTAAENPRSVAAFRLFLQQFERLYQGQAGDLQACYRQLLRRCNHYRLPGAGGAFSPVQVLSPEQAYDRSFEAAWIVNMTLENWPPRPVSNAFFPAGAARGIPRATEEGMLAYTRKLTRNLLECAPEIRLSWCNQQNDLPVSASTLIAAYPEWEDKPATLPDLWHHVFPETAAINGFRQHAWLRATVHDHGTAVSPLTDPDLPALVKLLDFQSACPLAAYLRFRAAARMPAPPEPFVDAAYRGSLVHTALHKLYQPHRGSKNMPDPSGVPAAVQHALEIQRAGQRLLPAVLRAEQQLLESMLSAWLAYEQTLQVFEVAELEWPVAMRVAGLNIQIQVDRLDRLADGRVIVLDYKTGSASSSSGWADQRLRDLQLPLYAVLLCQQGQMAPAGVAFATVGLYEAGTEGFGDEAAGPAYRVSSVGDKRSKLAIRLISWPEALEFWERSITALLQEYMDGDARHQVFDEASLKYADLGGVLRSAESLQWIQERPFDAGL